MHGVLADCWGGRCTMSALALHEEPAARLESHGAAALADSELVAALCGGAAPAALEVARRLVADAGSLAALSLWPVARLEAGGLKRGLALRLVAAVEVGRRVAMGPAAGSPMLDHAEGVAQYMAPITQGLEVEKFWVLCLNRKGRLLKRVEVSSGTASATLVHPREVFRPAIQEGASGIICAHNHPSGDPCPSAQDVRITRTLREAATAVDISLIDHVVMGRQDSDPLGAGFYSFRAAGMM